MMQLVRRLRLVVFTSAAVAMLGLALGPGCRDATQVTVEITLATRATCAETNGTAITVGTDPATTQQRVADEFVTATTTSCTEATREIGTLVVTPGGDGRASIIVVVAYDKAIVPSSCKPPLFKGCIVARRQFTFSEHQQLHLPITIDPDCKDVPCDAFSTCRTGKCFSSDVSCAGDSCLEPGDPGDGGTSVDGQVIPDTGVVDGQVPLLEGGIDASLDASLDALLDALSDGPITTDSATGLDGATDGGAPTGVFCDIGGNLMCPTPTQCNTGFSCCGPIGGGGAAVCNQLAAACQGGAVQYCCPLALCPGGKPCSAPVMGLPMGATPAGICGP